MKSVIITALARHSRSQVMTDPGSKRGWRKVAPMNKPGCKWFRSKLHRSIDIIKKVQEIIYRDAFRRLRIRPKLLSTLFRLEVTIQIPISIVYPCPHCCDYRYKINTLIIDESRYTYYSSVSLTCHGGNPWSSMGVCSWLDGDT